MDLQNNRKDIFLETLVYNFKKVILVELYIKNNKNIKFKDIGKIKVEDFCLYIVHEFTFYMTNEKIDILWRGDILL